MPIRNCPIFSFIENSTTVILPIKIINPKTTLFYRTWGLIDTGATECAIPAGVAGLIGHNLLLGDPKQIGTGNGDATAYGHTSTIVIYHPQNPDSQIIYTLDNVLIDFMPNLNVALLGVNKFLSYFVLNIDYPKRIFSLTK